VLVVLLVLAPTVAPFAAASPRPVPVCGPCSDRLLSGAAASNDLALSVESSTATVRLGAQRHEDWTVRADLSGADVDTLRDDPALATDVVEAAIARDTVAVSARVEGDTLVATYRTADFATRSFGAYRLDGLRDDAGSVVYTDLGADRLTVVGPEGTTAALTPSQATVDGDRVTFTSAPSGWTVFAPAGLTAPLVATLAVVDAVGVTLAANAVGFLVVPGLVLLGGLSGLRRLLGRPRVTARTRRPLAAGVAGLGLVALVHPFFTDVLPLVNDYDPSLFAGGVAALVVVGAALGYDRPSRPLTVETATATALCGFLLGVLAVFTLPLAVGEPFHSTDGLGDALSVSMLALPVVCCFPFGLASETRPRAGVGVALVAFALAAVVAFDFTTTSWFGVFAYVFALGGAVVTVLVGLPFAVLGRAVRDARPDASAWAD
jgi:hypothetical protein